MKKTIIIKEKEHLSDVGSSFFASYVDAPEKILGMGRSPEEALGELILNQYKHHKINGIGCWYLNVKG